MTRPVFIAAALLSGSASAFAQTPDRPAAVSSIPSEVERQQPPVVAPPPPAAAAPVDPAPPAAPAAPGRLTPDRVQRIYHIRQLEGMFTNAVKAGASSVANQLQLGEPSNVFVNGNARTRGFELEGYGIFFDVDVPTMMQSAVWATQVVRQQQYLAFLTRSLNDPTTDPNARRVLESELGRLQRAMARGQLVPIPAPGSPVPPLPGVAQAAPQGVVVAQTADAVPVAAAPPVDPNELYTETIKGALIDAMLSYGSALHISDNEWLTVAARATSQSAPGVIDDSSSIVLRIKGSDLTAFLTGKIGRDEAIKRIETKES